MKETYKVGDYVTDDLSGHSGVITDVADLYDLYYVPNIGWCYGRYIRKVAPSVGEPVTEVSKPTDPCTVNRDPNPDIYTVEVPVPKGMRLKTVTYYFIED